MKIDLLELSEYIIYIIVILMILLAGIFISNHIYKIYKIEKQCEKLDTDNCSYEVCLYENYESDNHLNLLLGCEAKLRLKNTK